MGATEILGLVKAQAPDHASCRAQEVVSSDGDVAIIQCACNTRLTLALPKAPAIPAAALDAFKEEAPRAFKKGAPSDGA